MDPATLLIIATSAWVGSEAIHTTGDTAKEVGGDIAAWRRGEPPPSHQRAMAEHDRKMEKLRGKNQQHSQNTHTNAALLNALRMADNATDRAARKSDHKTQADREFYRQHGDELARDRVQARIDRHRRGQEAAELFWAAWDEAIERTKQRLERKRAERLGNLTDEPTPTQPAGNNAGKEQPPTVDPQLLVLLVDIIQPYKIYPPPTPTPPGGHSPGGHRPQSEPPPKTEPSGPSQPDPVRAHAERIREEVPALAAPDHNTTGSVIADDGVIDAEIVDEQPPNENEAATTELATVHPIENHRKGPTMAEIEYTTAVAEFNKAHEHLEQFLEVVKNGRDALEGSKWHGTIMDDLEGSIKDMKSGLDKLSSASVNLKAAGDKLFDVFEATGGGERASITGY